MTSYNKLARHFAHRMHDESDSLAHPGQYIARRKFKTGGVLMLAVVIFAVVWMFPEIQRYLNMRRM